jgi:hypothetical protein
MADTPMLIDGVTAFPKGINSGISPLLLDRDTLSFSINGTVRGAFVTHRPIFRKMTLDFGNNDTLQSLVEKALFQGANFFVSEFGPRSLVASIGGRLFEFTPDQGTNVTVVDRTISTDPNDPGIALAWLWQSERWMIVQDGQKLPLFFDGQTTRRSFGPSQDLGQVAVGNDFLAPDIGDTIAITLTAPYTGPLNQNILIDDAFYQVNSTAGGGYPIKLKSINVPSTFGVTSPNGIDLHIPNSLIGVTNAAVSVSGVQPAFNVFIDPPISASAGFGTIGNIDNLSFYSNNINSVDNAVGRITFANTLGTPRQFPALSAVYQNYYSSAAVAGRTVETGFSAPAGIGSEIVLHLNAPYLGAVPVIVTTGGTDIWEITEAATTIPPSTIITVLNVDDTAGAAHGPATPLSPGLLHTIPEMEIGRMGAYGLGRNWYSLPDGRSFRATDIVGGTSGSPAVANRDSVLRETENTYLDSGDFIIPGNIGAITSMTFTAMLDVSLGQGALQVGTPSSFFSVNTPVDRSIWQSLENPILTQSLIGFGPLAQNSTVLANSDTLFRSPIGLGSLILGRREFNTWGNTPISREVQRIINQDTDRALLAFGSAVVFTNRLLHTSKPTSGPNGVFHRGFIALNFEPISSLGGKAQSVYDGLWTGINTLQVVAGTFFGVPRCFLFSYNIQFDRLELYELLLDDAAKFDNNGIEDVRITWTLETASLFKDVKGKGQFDSVQLQDGEFYLSDIVGTVDFEIWYKPSFHPCWVLWHQGQVCAKERDTSDSADDLVKPANRVAIGIGKPSSDTCDPINNRPYCVGETFQFKFVFTGSCKFYGALFKASPSPVPYFTKVVCETICIEDAASNCEPCKRLDCVGDDDYGTYLLQDRIQPVPETVFNQEVFFNPECGEDEVLEFSGTLPGWISIDTENNQLVGSSGTFSAPTQSEANALAQNALEAFGESALGTTLTCESESCGSPTTCTSIDLGAGFGDSHMVYHVGTTTLWTPERNSANLYVSDVTTLALIQTIDLSTWGGGWDAIVDTVNDQIVVVTNNGDLLFIDPVTYAITPLLSVIHSNGVVGRPAAYDSTRGNFLVMDVDRNFANDFFRLVSGASKSIIATNDHTPGKGSPVYCSDTDKFYFTYLIDPVLQEVDPVTIAVSATAFTLPLGGSYWIFQMKWVPEITQIWCYIKDGISNRGGLVFDPVTMTSLGTVSGPDVPGSWTIQEFCYQPCDNKMYLSDLSQVVIVDVDTFVEDGLQTYPDPSPLGMAFVQTQNAIWAATDQFLETPCP